MFTRPRHLLVVGLGALLGLSGAGCQSSARLTDAPAATPWVAQKTAPAAVPTHPPTATAQLLPPRKSTSDGVEQASGVALAGPVVRAGGPTPDGSVIASSWRPSARLTRTPVELVVVSRIERPVSPEPLRVGPTTSELPSSTRPVPALKGEAVVMHQAPARALSALAPGHPPGPRYPHPHHHVPAAPGVPREGNKAALPPYIIEPPDILLVRFVRPGIPQPIDGQHLVRPDGTIYLGTYGSVSVAGLTLDQAHDAIAAVLALKLKPLPDLLTYEDGITEYKIPLLHPDVKVQLADETGKPQFRPLRDELVVDVLAYNSKFYYVITDGGGYGEQVYRLPITGNETVLDALGQINGLPPVASKKKIWLARATPGPRRRRSILPVDWVGITQRGEPPTNYQILPGDRIYVQSRLPDPHRHRAGQGASPRSSGLLGMTLLGSSVVNSISGRGRGFGGSGN